MNYAGKHSNLNIIDLKKIEKCVKRYKVPRKMNQNQPVTWLAGTGIEVFLLGPAKWEYLPCETAAQNGGLIGRKGVVDEMPAAEERGGSALIEWGQASPEKERQGEETGGLYPGLIFG